MNVRRFISMFAVVLIGLTIFIPSYVLGEGNTLIELSPPKHLSDNRFCIEVSVRGVDNLYGLSAALRYNPEELLVEEIVPGDFLAADFKDISIDNGNGRSLYIETKTGNAEGISGSGMLFKVVFRSHDPSPSLNFHEIFNIILSDSSAQPIHYYMADSPSLWINKLPVFVNNPHLVISGGYKGEINSVFVNDLSAAEINREDKTFSASIVLNEGENIIEICGQDVLGQTYTLQKTLILDTIVPRIYIELPYNGGTFYEETVRIKGRAYDETGIEEFYIDGTLVQLDNDYFDVPILLKNHGINIVTLKAVDKAGNSSIEEIELYYKRNQNRRKTKRSQPEYENDKHENEPIDQGEIKELARDYVISIFEGHWSERYIKDLSEYNISIPVIERDFIPDESITDIEFIYILESAVKYSGNNDEKISENIEAISKEALKEGFITRNELALILSEILNLKEADEYIPPYKDLEDIPETFIGAVKSVSRQGLMIGFSDGYFKGDQDVTWGQGAAVILRTIRYLTGEGISPDRHEKGAIIENRSLAEEVPLIIINPRSEITYTNQDIITLEGTLAEGYSLDISDWQHYGYIVTFDTKGDFAVDWVLKEGTEHEIQFNYKRKDGTGSGTIIKKLLCDMCKPVLDSASLIPEEGTYISSWGSAYYPIRVKIIENRHKINHIVSGIDKKAFNVSLGGLEGVIEEGKNALWIEKKYGKAELETLAEGEHELIVNFSDYAGNSDGFTRKFYIDKTAPKVKIDCPNEGDTVSGIVTVYGTVYDKNIDKYSLYVDGNELPLAEGTSNIENGIIGQIDTAGIENGPITIKLEAVDKARNTGSTQIVVNVDNSSHKSYRLSGKVLLQYKGAKEGIVVYLTSEEDNIQTVIDSEGNFGFEVSKPGDYTLETVYEGYLSYAEDLYIDGEAHTDIQVTLLAGDINGDGTIDKDDLFNLARYFFIPEDDEDWNPSFDFNSDGKIDILDIVITALNIDI